VRLSVRRREEVPPPAIVINSTGGFWCTNRVSRVTMGH
jgi:hypothetical protein